MSTFVRVGADITLHSPDVAVLNDVTRASLSLASLALPVQEYTCTQNNLCSL